MEVWGSELRAAGAARAKALRRDCGWRRGGTARQPLDKGRVRGGETKAGGKQAMWAPVRSPEGKPRPGFPRRDVNRAAREGAQAVSREGTPGGP